VFSNVFGGAVDPGNWHRREWLPAMKALADALAVQKSLVTSASGTPRPEPDE
jgi:hypothetical protein